MSREPVDDRLDHLLTALGRARPRLDDLTRARVAAGLAEAIGAPAASPPRRRIPQLRRIAAITAAALVVVAVGAGFASRRGIPRVLGEPPANAHEVAAARRPPIEPPGPLTADGGRERTGTGDAARAENRRFSKEELRLALLDAVRRDALTGPGAAPPGADRGGGPGARAAETSPEAAPPAGSSPAVPAQAAATTAPPLVATRAELAPAAAPAGAVDAASPARVATAAEPSPGHGDPSIATGAPLRPFDDDSSRPDAAARSRVVDDPGVRSEGIITELRPLRSSESVVADDIAAIRLGHGSVAERYAAAESLLRRDPALARAMLSSLIAGAPQAPEAAQALLDLANLAVKSGGTNDIYVARMALDRIAVHPFRAGVAMPAAYLRCAIERNAALLRACLTQFRARFPSSPYDVTALARIAFSLVGAGDCAAARPLIAEYQRRYPSGDATAMVQTWHDRCSP
jgi:hypothetical protein